jgi:uncharacterized protein YbcI
MPEQEMRQRGSVSAAISTAMVRIVREYTGRGPTKAKTVINHDIVTVLMQDTMTKAEKALIAAGKQDIVLHMRQEMQRTMREDLIAVVEMNLERKVIAFMSDNHIEPDMAIEAFVLEPHEDTDRGLSDQDAQAIGSSPPSEL